MQFYIRADQAPRKLAILPGAFNPPTRAHLAMAESALSQVDEVLFVLPRAFPHKEYSGARLETRVEWLRAALDENPRFSLAVGERGLRQQYRGGGESRSLTRGWGEVRHDMQSTRPQPRGHRPETDPSGGRQLVGSNQASGDRSNSRGRTRGSHGAKGSAVASRADQK